MKARKDIGKRSIVGKVHYVVGDVLSAILARVLYFCLKIFNRFWNIKFFRTNSSRIGHLVGCTEAYLRWRKGNEIKENPFFVFYKPANHQYVKMLSRQYPVFTNNVLVNALKYKPLASEFVRSQGGGYDISPLEFNKKMKPSLSFSQEDKVKGKELLGTMGLGKEDWYICFHSRDSVYLEREGVARPGGKDYSCHNMRDCDIESYYSSAEYIVSKGGSALRIGRGVEKKIIQTEKIIDYATNYWSDFGDSYLQGNAKFFLGSACGLSVVASIFNIPVACANYISLGVNPCGEKDLFIVKKIWSIEKTRFLTFREILESGVSDYSSTEQYKAANLEWVDNSQAEILDLTIEMYKRLEGTWVSDDEDEYLQDKYHNLFRPQDMNYGFKSRIGAKFLRENKELLG